MTEARVMKELKSIREDLDYIKEHMIEADSILSDEDHESLEKYKKEKEEGKLVSHKELKKSL